MRDFADIMIEKIRSYSHEELTKRLEEFSEWDYVGPTIEEYLQNYLPGAEEEPQCSAVMTCSQSADTFDASDEDQFVLAA